jgi:uncharacterized protein YigE (DUF2233 family)
MNSSWKTIIVDEKIYAYDFFRVSDISKIKLIPNFQSQYHSSVILNKEKCTLGINAGFYDKNDRPIGLFIPDGKVVQTAISSSLLNGYFTINTFNQPAIEPSYDGDVRIALQTGPLLILDGQPLLLKIKNDEFARRSVAAVAKNGNVLFFSLFLPNSEISGPLLQNLPKILTEINKDQKLNISSAINLDGGSASFFKGKELYLEEITTVGAVFCVR